MISGGSVAAIGIPRLGRLNGAPLRIVPLIRLKEKMKQISAHMLEANVSDVTLEDGKFSVAGTPQKAVTFGEVAMAANLSNTLHPSIEPGLETTAFWEPEANTFPFGTHICVVEVDKEMRVPGYDSWWDVPVAEVSEMDVQIENGAVTAYRAKVKVSFKYAGGE